MEFLFCNQLLFS